MISLKKKQSGFTIVELLIVIVVIGILAAIVITTFTGVQKKGRDADRKSDINSMYGQVEVYFAENGKYPTLANMNDGSSGGFREVSMKGLSDDALTDPKGSGPTLVDAAAANSYAYIVTPSGCDNGAGGDCLGFTLTATLESGGTFDKNGSNN